MSDDSKNNIYRPKRKIISHCNIPIREQKDVCREVKGAARRPQFNFTTFNRGGGGYGGRKKDILSRKYNTQTYNVPPLASHNKIPLDR